MQTVTQPEQVARVVGRIVEHVCRQRAHAPVGTLMFLVQLDAEELLEQCGQPKRTNAEQLRRHPRVEEVGYTPPVVLAEKTQIVVGIMEHDLDLRVFEQHTEPCGGTDRQRVDHGLVIRRGELQQIDAVDKPMKAGSFGVERDRPNAIEASKKGVDGLDRVEVVRSLSRHNCA